MARVDFLIPGMQKAGTTVLAAFLGAHERIFMSQRKELHFFDRETDGFWDAPDYTAYEASFADAAPDQLCGEATPIYTFWPGALDRIHAYNPQMRHIVIIRDPVARAYSGWRMEYATKCDPLDFAETIRAGRDRVVGPDATERAMRQYTYVERGFYDVQIEALFSRFDPSQILVLLNEALKNDHRASLDRVTRFLGLPDFQPYPRRKRVQPDRIRKAARVHRRLASTAPLDPADAAYLRDIYRDSIERTMALTGLDLKHWLAEDRGSATQDGA